MSVGNKETENDVERILTDFVLPSKVTRLNISFACLVRSKTVLQSEKTKLDKIK